MQSKIKICKTGVLQTKRLELTAGHGYLSSMALGTGANCLRCALWVVYYSILRTGNARVLWCIFSGCHPHGSRESGGD